MHTLQQPYRDLYDDFYDYEGADFYDDLVRPWLLRQDGERRWMEELGGRRGNPIPSATGEELWRLYAFSRIVDLVLTHERFTEFMACSGSSARSSIRSFTRSSPSARRARNNSQWRTDFRRDYAIDGRLYYNVDRSEKRADDDLDPSERLEILRHRCFVRCTKPDNDLWPYDYTHQEDL